MYGNEQPDASGAFHSIVVDASGRTKIVGPVVEGGTPDGAPVLVGGIRTDTGNVHTLRLDNTGALVVTGGGGGGTVTFPTTAYTEHAFTTTNTTGLDSNMMVNEYYRSAIFIMTVTEPPVAPNGIQLQFFCENPVDGSRFTMASSVQMVTAGTAIIFVGTGMQTTIGTPAAGTLFDFPEFITVCPFPLPRVYGLSVVIPVAEQWTFSLAGHYLL